MALDDLIPDGSLLGNGTPSTNPTATTPLTPTQPRSVLPASFSAGTLLDGALGRSAGTNARTFGTEFGQTPQSPTQTAGFNASTLGSILQTPETKYTTPDLNSGTPLNVNLPQYTKSFESKWAQISSADYKPDAIAALRKIDAQRIVRGQPPLTLPETLTALDSADARQVKLEQKADPTAIFSNAMDDLSAIGKSIIHIPELVVNEVKALDDLPGQLSKADSLTDITRLPGVRMIPGAYTVGNIADGTEGLKEMGRHPLMTLLDVLPAAGKLAKSTPVVKAAEAASESSLLKSAQAAEAAKLTGAPTPYMPPVQNVNPYRTLITRRLTPEGTIVPNRVGQVTEALSKTKGGQLLSESFGAKAREASSMLLHAQRGVENAVFLDLQMVPDQFANHPILPTVRRSAELLTGKAQSEFGITPERMVSLTDDMRMRPETINSLPDNELAFVDEVRNLNREYADFLVSDEGGNLLHSIDGEYYDATTGKKLTNKRTKFTKAEQNFIDKRLGRGKAFEDKFYVDPDGKIQRHLDEVTGKPIRDGSTIRELAEAPGADPRLWELYDQLDNGQYKEARTTLNSMMRGRTRLGGSSAVGPEGPGANIGMSTIKTIANELEDLIEKQARSERAFTRAVPARFQDVIDRNVGEVVLARGIDMDPARAADFTQAVAERRYRDVLPQHMIQGIKGEVAATWKTLRDEGLDPVFVHRVSPQKASAIRYPRVLPEHATLGQVKARTTDMAPMVNDVSVALTHQGVEILEQAGSRQLTTNIQQRWGKTLGELRDEHLAQAQARHLHDPSQSVDGHLTNIINRDYAVFDPDAFMGSKAVKIIGDNKLDQTLIPKTVMNTFERMRKTPSELGTVTSLPMRAFRTSVLALSPRWHAYNVVGGALMLQGRTGPGVWKYMAEARNLIKNGGLPDELKLALGGAGRDIQELNFYKGRTLGRIWNEIRAKHPGLAKTVDAGGKVVAKSYDLNAFFDDTYRTMAYLYGQDKAFTKGLTAKAAEARGMALAKKVMVNWDAMTPIERGIIKHVFPFYGFTQHMMRYAMQFPVDHPFRAAVVGSFGRTEMEALDGLPDAMMNALFFGDEDQSGNRRAISFSGANPFADMASLFTLSGFIGGVNPFISTGLRTLGFDPQAGGGELYPNLRYDPDTGLQLAQNDNPLSGLVLNTIPQARVLAALTNTSAEFKELRRSNPEAAMRMLRGQLGLPIGTRRYNMPEEYAKQTLKIREAGTKAKNEAIKTGSDEYVSQFPQLDAYVRQMRELQANGDESLAPYVMPVPAGGNAGLLGSALNLGR